MNLTLDFEFSETMIYWRGPAPWYFVPIPEQQSEDIKAISDLLTYGWGVIPVEVQIGDTVFKTSLFPKDDRYLVPVKVAVRKAENITEGDLVAVKLSVNKDLD